MDKGGLQTRRIEPELLDHAPPEETRESLSDIERINRLLGGYLIYRQTVKRLLGARRNATLLDVGAASGDMGRSLRRTLPQVRVTNLDQRLLHLAKAPDPKLAGDAFRLPFAPQSFDIVSANLFLHHFEDEDVSRLLASFFQIARIGVVIVDLARTELAYRFLPMTRPLFRWHPLTVHDGTISVAAAFRPEELSLLAERAGVRNVECRSHWPWCRVSLLARR